MPEQDDKHDADAPTKTPERRFWHALSGDKPQQQIKEAADSNTSDKNSETAVEKRAAAARPGSPAAVSTAADSATIAKPDQPGKSHSEKSQTRHCSDSVDLTPGDEQRLTPAQQSARRETLRTMLHRSEARQQSVKRKRRPVLAAGTQVRVASGPHVGQESAILDADYIESRVLLELGQDKTPTWINFDQVTGPRRKS